MQVVVVVIEFWAFFHPEWESHYWPPPEFDLICTEYLNALSFGDRIYKEKKVFKRAANIFTRPFLYTVFWDDFLQLYSRMNFLFDLCLYWPLKLGLSPAFFPRIQRDKKGHIHSLHIAKIPLYSTLSSVWDLKWLNSQKKIFKQTNRQTDILNRLFMI